MAAAPQRQQRLSGAGTMQELEQITKPPRYSSAAVALGHLGKMLGARASEHRSIDRLGGLDRRQIVLPDPVDEQLRELAAAADTPPSTLAAQMVQADVAQAVKDGKVRPLCTTPVLTGARGERPSWLEPYGGDVDWRREMWGAIVALHGRYPTQLATLKDGWWTDESTTEMLSALAVWRAELDDGGQDPREEIAFQHQLADYAQVLRQQGGGVTKAWQPGAPPTEWVGE